MNIIDRLILTICSLCLAVLSIIVILFPFQQLDILSRDNLNLVFKSMEGNFFYCLMAFSYY